MTKTTKHATCLVVFSTFALCFNPAAETARRSISTGTVIDFRTHKPIAGAWVTQGERALQADAGGTLPIDPNGTEVQVRGIGYGRVRAAVRRDMRIELEPLRVRGLYLSFWLAGFHMILATRSSESILQLA